jgi:hypothetical protein
MQVRRPDRERFRIDKRAKGDRGVSTVVDATLALLLISAATVLVGTALSSERERQDPAAADHTAEALSAATVHVEYSLAGVRTAAAFPGGGYSTDRFDRQRYGSVPELLAGATMANATIDGRPLTDERASYAAAVEGSVLELLAGTGYDARVVALWRPYENASLGSRVTVGRAPPADADVSSAVLRVQSGVDLSGAAVGDAYRRSGRYDDAADLIAEAVVERYFPPAETQRALEGKGLDRALAVYRYRRVAGVLRTAPTAGNVSFDLANESDPLAGNGTDPATPNASAASEALAGALSDLIEAELRAAYTRAELSSGPGMADQVRIIVEVWES